MKFAAIILAAGSSSRMGRSKQMLDIHGEKLLVKTIQTFFNAGMSRIVVVLGSEEPTHREVIKNLSVDIVANTRWETGMGSSIKRGLAYLMAKASTLDGVIISVCDQPLLSKETIFSLMSRYQETGKPIIASAYSGASGVPVLFHKRYFDKLAKLPDDQGAKKIIIHNQTEVSVVPFPGGETDLDTIEDYHTFLRQDEHGSGK